MRTSVSSLIVLTGVLFLSARPGKHRGTLVGSLHAVGCMAFSPDGKHLVAAGGDESAKVIQCDDD